MSSLGTAIKDLREKRKKSQKFLATEIGISPQYLSNIENGKSTITGDKLKAASKALRTKSSSLLDLAVADYKSGLVKQMKKK